MKQLLSLCLYVVFYHLVAPVTAYAQSPVESTTTSTGKGLFETDKVLEITLSGNIRQLMNDREATPLPHPITLLYRQDDSSEIAISAEGKTRGHFRKLKDNCLYPPVAIHFTKSESLATSIFKEQDKLKLVMPCRGDEYVVREWLVYKLYNLVTPKSFRARLVRIRLNDANNKKAASPFYGILLEEEKQMAKRNGAVVVKKKLQPDETAIPPFLTMAVFEYLIGNTDWSIEYLQNIKLIARDSNALPTAVAYDFDHSGLVNAPYAEPPELLLMNSVRERRYRGYCVTNMKQFGEAIALFNHLKNDIYGLYTGCTLLDEKYIKATVKYLDEFYATINNEDKMQKEFGYPCDKNGTGNVVIKGLKED